MVLLWGCSVFSLRGGSGGRGRRDGVLLRLIEGTGVLLSFVGAGGVGIREKVLRGVSDSLGLAAGGRGDCH